MRYCGKTIVHNTLMFWWVEVVNLMQESDVEGAEFQMALLKNLLPEFLCYPPKIIVNLIPSFCNCLLNILGNLPEIMPQFDDFCFTDY